MTEQETKKGMTPFNKKWVTIAGLVLLSVGLIFVFRQKSLQEIVDQQKVNLAGFYSQNLEPIFSGSILSKEDIFNFAFYKELPVDKKNNQVLTLGVAPDGKDFFEFRNAGYNSSTDNLQQFVTYLQLDKSQQEKLDSILDVYKDKIQDQVLVNDKNTLAINSDLWNLNKALAADLMLFASGVNKERANELFAGMLDSAKQKSLQKIVAEVKSSESNKYIFVHSDTIFTGSFNYKAPEPGKTAQKEKDQKITLKFDSDLTKTYSQTKTDRHNFHVQVDTDYFRIQVPELAQIYIANEKEINEHLKLVVKRLHNVSGRFKTPVIPPPPVPGRKDRPRTDPQGDFEMNLDLENLDSVIEAAITTSLEAIAGSALNPDSLEKHFNDSSLTPAKKAKLRSEMQKMKKEFEKLKLKNRQKPEDAENNTK